MKAPYKLQASSPYLMFAPGLRSSYTPMVISYLSVPFAQVYFPYVNHAHSMTHCNITILILSHRLAPNATISLSQHTAKPLEFTHVTGNELYTDPTQVNVCFYSISSSYLQSLEK